jgi:hypothetical protein
MTTSYTREKRATEVREQSAWRLPRFQRFAAITVATSLLLSFVAISCLNGDVNIVKNEQIPFIQSQLNEYKARHNL